MIPPFFFVIITFVIIITMSLLAMLLPKNMIANGCALSLLRVCTACAVPCPNTIIELTMAARKRDVNKIQQPLCQPYSLAWMIP